MGLPTKVENSMFFGLWKIIINPNYSNPSRFQEDNLFAHFGIQKRSPKRSPPGPGAKNTFKNWLKMNFELFQSTQNNRSGGSVLGSVFSYSKSMECHLSLPPVCWMSTTRDYSFFERFYPKYEQMMLRKLVKCCLA